MAEIDIDFDGMGEQTLWRSNDSKYPDANNLFWAQVTIHWEGQELLIELTWTQNDVYTGECGKLNDESIQRLANIMNGYLKWRAER